MNEADFAIVTPSVTVNEIVYLGVPFIAIKTAENQRYMYEYLKETGNMVLPEFNVNKFRRNLQNILEQLSMMAIVNFTELSLDEKKMVLQWRNHPDIAKWMFTQETISLEDHLSYIESLKSKKDKVYFLVKKGLEAIGVIDLANIDYEKRSAEIGIYAKPQLRGVGSYLMEAIIDYALHKLKINTLFAKVFTENISAIKLYKRYHFKTYGKKEINNKQIQLMELDLENR
jgi:UDP-4-amino-4,6-dideoxy-N-acetyl-beta-L-altrosamine N-acetyltransferase